MTVARYDQFADWYEDYVNADAVGNTDRTRETLQRLLRTGNGRCLDVCCGTGTYAAAITELGWAAIGVDVSRGQLRHAKARLNVVCGAAEALPIASNSFDAAVCVRCHTDVPDYVAVVREVPVLSNQADDSSTLDCTRASAAPSPTAPTSSASCSGRVTATPRSPSRRGLLMVYALASAPGTCPSPGSSGPSSTPA